MRKTLLNYDLIQCVIEWIRLFAVDTELSEVDRTFIENCIDAERVKQLLAKFLFAIKAKERHNARYCNCAEGLYQELSDQLFIDTDRTVE